jgi:hypothetical protein
MNSDPHWCFKLKGLTLGNVLKFEVRWVSQEHDQRGDFEP